MQVVVVALAFLSCAGFIWAHMDPCWKVSSGELEVQPYKVCYGLWKVCTYTAGDSQNTCDGTFGKTILELRLPARVHFIRAATITGSILCGICVFLAAASGRCCRIESMSYQQKRNLKCISGLMFLLAGLLVVTATSWYASVIYQERLWYYETGTFGLQHKFGRGIYLAWGSGCLALIAAIVSLCSCDGQFAYSDGRIDSNQNTHRFREEIRKFDQRQSRVEYI